MENKQNSFGLYFSILVIVVFILGRVAGSSLFDNHWSFNHWSFLPLWYIILWLVVFGATIFLLIKYFEKIGRFFETRQKVIIGLILLLLLTAILHFDSFLYGAGNLRIAQIGQVGKIIYPWYEFGSILTVTIFFHFFNLFPLSSIETVQANTAAVFAWRTLVYLATTLSLVGSAKLVKEISSDTFHRFYLFVIFFFGGQTLLYFGFIGVEPVIIAATIWFAYWTVKITSQFTFIRLLLLWLVALIAVFMHMTALYLFPALIYLTFSIPFKKIIKPYLAITIVVISLVALLLITYTQMGASFRFSQYLLFFKGQLPHTDYGLFSGRHIGDIFQLIFLSIPLLIIIKLLALRHIKELRENPAMLAGWFMGVTGIIVIFITNPINNIVLDFPRFIAYLTPLSFVFVLLLAQIPYSSKVNSRWLAILAATALMLPFSYLPAYIKIDPGKYYLEAYLEKHESFYRTGLIAVRDAHFYRKEFRNADYWEWQLPVKSLEYLNLKGVRDLIMGGRSIEAVDVLYQAISRNPYWTEPRDVLAVVQMNLGRFELAKSQIDTCLLLEPYNKTHLSNLYRYFRDSRNYVEARKLVDRELTLFPQDTDVLIDLMVINYHLEDIISADTLADRLIEKNADLPFPYLIKGFIKEDRNELKAAIGYYQKFLELGPNETEKPMIEQKLERLQTLVKDQKS